MSDLHLFYLSFTTKSQKMSESAKSASASAKSAKPDIVDYSALHDLGVLDKPHYDTIMDAIMNDRLPAGFYDHVLKYLRLCFGGAIVPVYMKMYRTISRNNGITDGDDVTNEHIKKHLLDMSEMYLKKNNRLSMMKYMNNIYPFTSDNIEQIDPLAYTTYRFFVIFGDPTSTDIDVLVILPRDPTDPDNKIKMLTAAEKARMLGEFADLYGSDVTDRLDLSYAIIDGDGRLLNVSKGGEVSDGANETCNIIMDTYQYHPQTDAAIDFIQTIGFSKISFNSYDVDAKIRSISMYVFKHLEYIVTDDVYGKYRKMRTKVFDGQDMTVSGKDVLDHVIYDIDVARQLITKASFNNHYSWRSRMKALTMKLLQAIYCYIGRFDLYSYIKMKLADSASNILDYFAFDDIPIAADSLAYSCRYYLSRGNDGVYDPNCMPYLFRIYSLIVDSLDVTGDIDVFDPFSVGSSIPLDIVQQFVASPVTVTPDFVATWIAIHGDPTTVVSPTDHSDFPRLTDDSIGAAFNYDITDDIKILDEFTQHVDDSIGAALELMIVMVGQRTEEWMGLLDHFTCGNNNANRKNTGQGSYNLIRGCIMEELIGSSGIMDVILGRYLSSSYIVIDVGFFVTSMDEGADGAAPDKVILINHGDYVEIIPLEFKALKHGNIDSPKKNTDHRRGLSLAKRQNVRMKKIIDSHGNDRIVVKSGIIVLAWIVDSMMCTETYFYDM